MTDPESLERGFNDYLTYVRETAEDNDEEPVSENEVIARRDAFLAGAAYERRQMVKFLSGFRKQLALALEASATGAKRW